MSLAGGHQVICVTHLPQVAAYGDAHFRVSKALAEGRTATLVSRIESVARVEEIEHMLGTETAVARENALQLLEQGDRWKAGARREASVASV